MRAEVLTTRLDPAKLLRDFTRTLSAGVGGVVSFTGHVRATSATGEVLAALHLKDYRSMTLGSLTEIATSAAAHFDLLDGLVVHRAGRILPGDAVVFVATAAAHRRAAFEGADWLMDKLKTEALFWKAEEAADGTKCWIEPTIDDYSAAARWERVRQVWDRA